MNSNQANALLNNCFCDSRKIGELLEALPLFLNELRQDTGVSTEEVMRQLQICRAIDNRVPQKILEAQALLETERAMYHAPLVYGPNPCFRPKNEDLW